MAKKKLNSVIGVDIGSQSIKVAELRSTGRDFSISALGMSPTPEGMVDHTGVYDTDTLGAIIKELCQKAGCSINQMVFSIAGQASCLVRTLEVPKMNPGELKEHMNWEISRNIPFAESTVQSDYRAFPAEDPNATNMDVVMAIAPQSAIDTLMGIAKKAAKQVHALDVEPLSLARSLATSYHELSGETVCVIEIGHKTTAINMYHDGKLLLPRQVPVGGEQFTNAIANALGIPLSEAEELKVTKGEIPANAGQSNANVGNPFLAPATPDFAPYNPFVDDTPAVDTTNTTTSFEPDAPAADNFGVPTYDSPFAADDTPAPAPAPVPATIVNEETMRIYNAMAVDIDEFIAEVRRSIDYFRSRGGDVHRILLAGGGANMKGLEGLLSRSIGIHAEALDPFKGMQITAKKMEFGLLEEHRGQFAVAVGNSLHIAFE